MATLVGSKSNSSRIGRSDSKSIRTSDRTGIMIPVVVMGCVFVVAAETVAVLEFSHLLFLYMGGCQNYGPFLDPYYNMEPNI